MLARDKALTKKELSFHRIPYPEFIEVPQGRTVRRPKWLAFPLIVKSVSEEASLGISQASIVEDDDKLGERVTFIHNSVEVAPDRAVYRGREFYVGIIGSGQLQITAGVGTHVDKLPEDAKRIATERVKWSRIISEVWHLTRSRQLAGKQDPKIQDLAKRVYRALGLSSYARIDMRMDAEELYVLANPNLVRRMKILPFGKESQLPLRITARTPNVGLRVPAAA